MKKLILFSIVATQILLMGSAFAEKKCTNARMAAEVESYLIFDSCGYQDVGDCLQPILDYDKQRGINSDLSVKDQIMGIGASLKEDTAMTDQDLMIVEQARKLCNPLKIEE